MTTESPKRIWTESEPYDFEGYSPCWVWHGDEAVEETEGLTAYVRADIHEALLAERDRLAREVAEARSGALREAEEVALKLAEVDGSAREAAPDGYAKMALIWGEHTARTIAGRIANLGARPAPSGEAGRG